MTTAKAMTKVPETTTVVPGTTTAKPLFVEAEQLFEQMKDLTQTIGKRAYEFFEWRGREWGQELEDWFRAEAELLRRLPVEITEEGNNLIVRAEVPGFKAEEIKISVEPERLVISGKAEQQAAKKEEQTVYSEWRAQQFCRAIELPGKVDTTQVTATLKDGILQLAMPRVAAQAAVQVAVKSA
jgi:HSP20 family protein